MASVHFFLLLLLCPLERRQTWKAETSYTVPVLANCTHPGLRGASPFTRGRVWYTSHQRLVLLSQQILANKVSMNVNSYIELWVSLWNAHGYCTCTRSREVPESTWSPSRAHAPRIQLINFKRKSLSPAPNSTCMPSEDFSAYR